jgi:hypothetical protein
MTEVSRQRRRWYQYRLRTLFLLTGACAVASSGLSVKWQAERERETASRQFRHFGGDVSWEDVPWWSAQVKWADFSPFGYMKAWAPYKGEGVTDDQLRELKPWLKRVEALYLGGTQLSNAGMEHLAEMNRLKRLDLISTAITVLPSSTELL